MHDTKEPDHEIVKPAWETPTIEEIDYARTEAAYAGAGAADFGLYSL